ncbi:MAG: dehydrogenase [Desulfomonilaceae bacterium]
MTKQRVVRSRAPLRLGLAGGGTDLSPFCDEHGGYVLNATINMYAYCSLARRKDRSVCFQATDHNAECVERISETLPHEGPIGFLAGVYSHFMRRMYGNELVPIDMATYCEAPPGSGLGSSSTMVVAICRGLAELLGIPLGDYDLAQLAYLIERVDLGLQGGRQDQYAAAFGGVNFMEFYADNRVLVNPLRIKPYILSELEASLLLYYTGRSRASESIIKHQVQNISAKKGRALDAMLRVKEEALKMKEALLKGDFEKIGSILKAGWVAKKKTAHEVTNPDIERIMNLALGNGAIAGKVSGAGGGGFIMFLVDPLAKAHLSNILKRQSGIVFTCSMTRTGAEAWNLPKEAYKRTSLVAARENHQ